jgi:hypothetical protein
MKFFRETAASRLKELIRIVEKYGRPWYVKAGVKNEEFLRVPEGWYRKY